MGKPVSTLITLPFNLVNPILRKIYKNNTYTHMIKNENTTNAKQLSLCFHLDQFYWLMIDIECLKKYKRNP